MMFTEEVAFAKEIGVRYEWRKFVFHFFFCKNFCVSFSDKVLFYASQLQYSITCVAFFYFLFLIICVFFFLIFEIRFIFSNIRRQI